MTCICGNGAEVEESVDELRAQLEDIMVRRRDLVLQAVTDPRLLPDLDELRFQEMDLRSKIERATFG